MKLTHVAIAGQLLLWAGFMGGALAAVFRLENSEAPWQTIPWLPYLGCAVVGVAGVFLLRKDRAAHRLRSALSAAGIETVASNLCMVAERLASFASVIEQKTCEEVLEFIDEECAPWLAEFAEGRLAISDRFGPAAYAAIMTEFASGERYLNRAWSAAADGYVDEVAIAIDHASSFLNTAQQKLQVCLSEPHQR